MKNYNLLKFFTDGAFSRHFCPKRLTVIHTHICTPMAVAAMQGADQHIRSSLGFSIFPKDTSTCRPGELNQRPSNNKMMALPLSYSRPLLKKMKVLEYHNFCNIIRPLHGTLAGNIVLVTPHLFDYFSYKLLCGFRSFNFYKLLLVTCNYSVLWTGNRTVNPHRVAAASKPKLIIRKMLNIRSHNYPCKLTLYLYDSW